MQHKQLCTQYEGFAFFMLAVVAAASVMITFLGLVAGAAGGATYGLLRVAGQRRRIAPAADGRRRLQGQQVRGYSNVNLNGESYYRPQRPGHGGGGSARLRRPAATRVDASGDGAR